MKKLFTNLLLMLVMGVGSAWADGTSIGAYTDVYLGSKTDTYTLSDGKTINFSFTNDNNGTTDFYKNYIIVANDNAVNPTNYFVLRADNWETVAWAQTGIAQFYGGTATELNGATVNATISYYKGVAYVNNVITTTGSKTYYYSYKKTITNSPSSIGVYLSEEAAKLSNIVVTENGSVTTFANNLMTDDCSTQSSLWKAGSAGNDVSLEKGTIKLSNTQKGARVNYYDLSGKVSSYDWNLSFDAKIQAGQSADGHNVTIAGANTSSPKHIETASDVQTKSYCSIYCSSKDNPTVFTVYIGGTAQENTVTLENNIMYHFDYKLVGTTFTVTITNGETSVYTASTTVDPSAIGALARIWCWNTRKTNGTTSADYFDNISLSTYHSSTDMQVTANKAVNGTNRDLVASENYNNDIYYITSTTGYPTYTESTTGTKYDSSNKPSVSESTYFVIWSQNGTVRSFPYQYKLESAGAITLNAPTLKRTDNATLTITSDQSTIEGAPTPTYYYYYGENAGDAVECTSPLTLTQDGAVTVYAAATGYTNSTSVTTDAYKLRPNTLTQVENAPISKSDIYSLKQIRKIGGVPYGRVFINGTAWGNFVMFEAETSNTSTGMYWGIRNGTWYVQAKGSYSTNAFMLFPEMNANDVIYVNTDAEASTLTNATRDASYDYPLGKAYIVTADGDVQLGFKRINRSTNNYLQGVYAYSSADNTNRGLLSTDAQSLTVSAAGYATFSSQYAVDLDNMTSGYTAYTVTNGTSTSAILTKATGVVPAKTGLIIKGEAGTVTFPVSFADGTAPEGTNYLIATNGATKIAADNYVLGATKDDVTTGIGFYTVTSDGQPTLQAGQSYLSSSIPSSGAKALYFSFDDDVTGISNVNATANANNAVRYNLAGQRVSANTKGIVIMNGKKYLNK